MSIFMTTLTYGTFFAYLTTVEVDQGKVNHLFSFRDQHARDILLSYTGRAPIGTEGSRVWIAVRGMECAKVNTIDDYLGREISAVTYLCEAEEVNNI